MQKRNCGTSNLSGYIPSAEAELQNFKSLYIPCAEAELQYFKSQYIPCAEVIKMLKGQKKHIHKEHGKIKHEAPRSVHYRATENKHNIGTTALERSVVYTTGVV